VIPTGSRHRRPKGIYWPMLPDEKIAAIPVLQGKKPR
jgi:hypothetical protein